MITYFSCFFHLRVVTRVEICIADADKHLFPISYFKLVQVNDREKASH